MSRLTLLMGDGKPYPLFGKRVYYGTMDDGRRTIWREVGAAAPRAASAVRNPSTSPVMR